MKCRMPFTKVSIWRVARPANRITGAGPAIGMELLPMRGVAPVFAILFATLTGTALAQVPPQNSRPAATAKIDTIPAPRDVAYPGTIQLTIDASDVTRGIFKVSEHVPVPGPGDFVLLYPEWLPGHHSRSG